MYSSSQKYSNKHILNHNFFSLESFGFKFSGHFYIQLDQILAKNWKFWLQLYQTGDTYVDFRLPKVLEQYKRPQTLKV
jgi:glutamyl/glutaminyl-tRNA synthetase